MCTGEKTLETVDQDCIASLQAGLNQEDAIELDENEIVGFSL